MKRRWRGLLTDFFIRGLAWHTNDETLRHRFQEFGTVEEAVRYMTLVSVIVLTDTGGREGSRYQQKSWIRICEILIQGRGRSSKREDGLHRVSEHSGSRVAMADRCRFDGRIIRVDHATDNRPGGSQRGMGYGGRGGYQGAGGPYGGGRGGGYMNPFNQGRGGGFVSNYNRGGYGQHQHQQQPPHQDQQQSHQQQHYHGGYHQGGYQGNAGDGGDGYGQAGDGQQH